MKTLVNYLLFCTLLILSSFSNQSLAQNSCTAKAPAQVAVGQNFRYEVSVNNENSKITSTDFSNFNVISGPGTTSSFSFSNINGKTTQNTTLIFTYILAAKKTGTYTIGPTTVKVGNNTIKSNPVTIQVVQGNPQTQQRQGGNRQQQNNVPSFNAKDVFIKAFASKSNPYQGEQVLITHKLYIGASVNGGFRIDNINIPSQNGLWSYTLGDPNAQSAQSTEVVDGKRYSVYEIRKTAVFPQKTGEITVTPMEMKFTGRIIYQQGSGDPFFDQFFGGSQRAQDYTLDLKSNSIKLNIKELPKANQPENFTGITGTYTIKSLLSRDKLKANDATNLTITISGSGNLQYINNPGITFPEGMDVSEPKITDNINTTGNSVSGSRIFEYVIIPRNEGTFTIPAPQLTFFNIQNNAYKTITGNSFTLNVEKGNGDNQITASGNQKNIKFLGKEIRFIKSTKPKFRTIKETHFFGSPFYYSFFIIFIILFILILIIRKNQIEYHSNSALIQNKRAHKVASKNLKNAQKLLQLNQKDPFYIEISRALWGYVSHKYQIPLAQLSIENIEMNLKTKGISELTIHSFIETLQLCEYARFAPDDNTQMMHEMYEKALQFILKNESIHKNEQ
jgi:hypothetical protein